MIQEAFKGFEVRYFLAIIVDGAAEVVVVFPVGRSAAVFNHVANNPKDTVTETKRPRDHMAWLTKVPVRERGMKLGSRNISFSICFLSLG